MIQGNSPISLTSSRKVLVLYLLFAALREGYEK
jgi:hypothetical protein